MAARKSEAPPLRLARRPRKVAPRIPQHIRDAVVAGPAAFSRGWREIEDPTLWTTAEQVMAFGETYLKVPQGSQTGQTLHISLFQEVFLRAVFDNPVGTTQAILSMARRNGKTFTTALISLAYLVGPLATPNSIVGSAANSRDQASLVYKDVEIMISSSPLLGKMTKLTPSLKLAKSLLRGTEFLSMSADARTGYGKSLKVVILDEAGQIVGPETSYVSMLRSSQGSHVNPLFVTISTQAPADSDYLSVLIDDSIRAGDPSMVCHLYTTPKEADLLDEDAWLLSNPGVEGGFRMITDLRRQLVQAERIPAREAHARNLLLNQRISLVNMWLAPRVWAGCAAPPNLEVFKTATKVGIGLDLSARLDLTSAVVSAMDAEGVVHLLPYTFTPLIGLEDRAAKDRVPYDAWVRAGLMIPVPGETISYAWVCEYLDLELKKLGILPSVIAFDRWRIELFKSDAQRVGFAQGAEWQPVGQGFRDMAPRLDLFEELLASKRIRHGNHPCLNLGASNAIATSDPAGNRKLDKSKASQRIDTAVAMVMSVYSVAYSEKPVFDLNGIIG